MLGSLKVFALVYFQFISIECLIPSLMVKRIDKKLINRKRQDTLEMCKIFTTGNERKRDPIPNPYENIRNLRRGKRNVDDKVNPEDLQRVENIVEHLYDDTMEPRPKIVEGSRRFDFAPALLLGPDQVIDKNDETPHPRATVAVKWPKRWPKGVIPFFIDSKTYDMALAEIIMKAFDYFEKTTCIRLQRLREKPTDQKSLSDVEWLYISNPSGIRQCVHSNEHKKNQGVQMVVFGYDCMSQGEIVHEVMHIMGFSHEHTRPDRDRYVTIMWDNIKPGYKKYFQLRTEDPLVGLPYDYDSVLHYPQRAFSKNGQVTVLTEPGAKIGQREGLSDIDVEKIGLIYSNECVNRNMDYLLKTCPIVVKSNEEPKDVNKDDIDNYFEDRLWPYGIINYKLRDKMEFSVEERENIKAVMRHIEKETCIEFRELSSYEKDGESDEDVQVPDYDINKEIHISGNTMNEKQDTTAQSAVAEAVTDEALSDKAKSGEVHTDKAKSGEAVTDKVKSGEVVIDKVKSGEALSDKAKSSEALNDKANSGGALTDKGKSDEAPSNKAISGETEKAKSGEVLSDQAKSGGQALTDHPKSGEVDTDQAKSGGQALTDHPKSGEVDNGAAEGVWFNETGMAADYSVWANVTRKLQNHNEGNMENGRLQEQIHMKTKQKKWRPPTPSRRHAKNIFIITRKNQPGCPCPRPGKPDGNQVLEINNDCFNTVNDLLHLFVHVLGLEHQHNMHDRDQYLQIVWANISPDIKDDLQTVLPPAASVGFPYDYQSVMHYPWLEIKDGVTNIMYPIWNDGWAMGHWQGLSWTDVQKINLLYRKQCTERKKYADKH